MITDMMKILRINAYIQRSMGDVLLDGKKVVCVSLDNTCAVEEENTGEIPLIPEQIDHLFKQTFSV